MTVAAVVVTRRIAKAIAIVDAVAKPTSNDLVPFLAGITFFCASLELLIPKPLPFFRLGLSNAVIMLAIPLLKVRAFILLLLLKIIGQALISGTLFSYIALFSLTGTLCSGLGMYCAKKLFKGFVSYLGVSCIGAFFSSLVQLSLSYFLVFGKGTLIFAPEVLSVSFLTSLCLGFFTIAFAENSTWYKALNQTSHYNINILEVSNESVEDGLKRKMVLRGLAGLILIALVTIFNHFIFKAFIFFSCLFLSLFYKVRVNFKITFFFLISMLLVNIFIPNGKLLFTIFNIKITDGAILLGLEKFFYFQILVLLSKWITQVKVNFKGEFGLHITKSFYVFNSLLESKLKNNFSFKTIIHNIDSALFSISKIG